MKWRIWLLSFGITLACVLVFGFASTQVYYNSSIDDSKKFLRVYMNFYNDDITADEAGARDFSAMLGGARVTFMDGRGNVLADSLAGENAENHADRTEVRQAISDGEGFAVRGSSTLGQNMTYYCKSVGYDLLVRIAVFTDSDWNIFAHILPTVASFAVVMVALCVVLAFLATRFIITPVKQLAEEAAGNNMVSTAYPELEPVAEILNGRNRDIKRQLSEIRLEKELAEKAKESKDEFISNVTHEMKDRKSTRLNSSHM